MSLYTRYASLEHDKDFFTQQQKQLELQHDLTTVTIPQLSSTFDNNNNNKQQTNRSVKDWLKLFPKLAFYTGYDELLFQQVLTLVQVKSTQYSTISLSKFGITSYEKLILDNTSRFYTSVENLIPKYQANPTRRALAITNLKNCNLLINHGGELPELPLWDGINAGQLTNSMVELSEKVTIGEKLIEFGLIQSHVINSFVVDVVYDNNTTQDLIQDNNKLVNLLGVQSQHLFDPLLEYSPESISITYTPPSHNTIQDSEHISAIINELITIQANYTLGLVELLQNFLIPLRITVLNSNNPATTITKLNTIFPPTIDEITRINCILHSALSKARQFNHQEVIKTLDMFMPYFYKAFIRHEANINGFSKKLHNFATRNRSNILDNLMINKSAYSIREIDSIIVGSLMELPKLKLILMRLRKELPTCTAETDEQYQSIIKIVDAFGTDEIKIDTTKRIFTPTGKILTELATNWPKELQYGWLTRKVVGIYELKNVKPINQYNIDVVIIFSDHILILTIVDSNYPNNGLSVSVSDILMHSLINQKPLPNYETFPKMEVVEWSKITDIIITSYQGVNSEYIRILNTAGVTNFSRNYQIDSNCSSFDIIQLFNKSKILCKSQPFHLFKSRIAQNMFTAHDISVYEQETIKSPFTIYLNMEVDINSAFSSNPDLQLLMQVSITDKICARSYMRGSITTVTIEPSKFEQYINDTLAQAVRMVFTGYNKITRAIIGSNGNDLVYLLGENNKIEQEKVVPVKKINSRDVSISLTTVASKVKEEVPPRKKKSFLSRLLHPFKRKKNKKQQQVQPKEVSRKLSVNGKSNKLTHSKSKESILSKVVKSKSSVKVPVKPNESDNSNSILQSQELDNSNNSILIHNKSTHGKTTQESNHSILNNETQQQRAQLVHVKRVNGAQLVETKSRSSSQSTLIQEHIKPKIETTPNSMRQVDSSINIIGQRRASIPFIHEFQDYYSDGTPNWESSISNSNSLDTLEVKSEDITERIYHEIDILKEKSMLMPKVDSDHSSIFSGGTTVQTPRMNSLKLQPKVNIPRELSVQSITPSEYAQQLSNIIDHEFSKIIEESEITLKPYQNLTSVTSDDEFDFNGCSDNNDATLTDKTLPITTTMRDESIAQLSALLNQVINV